MIRRLSSIRLTFWSLVVMILWLSAGTYLAMNEPTRSAFKELKEVLVLDWIFDGSVNAPVVTAWLFGICLVSLVLLINLLCCSLTRLWRRFLISQSPGSRSLLLIHLLFALVMFCHGISMVAGFKYGNIELYPGDTFAFNDDWQVKLSGVTFVDDPAMAKIGFKKSRGVMTRERFHRHANFAEVQLFQKGNVVAQGDVKILKPLICDGIRLTLTRFTLSEKEDGNQVGVILVVAESHVNALFFVLYGLLILSLAVFLVKTWRLPIVVDKKTEL